VLPAQVTNFTQKTLIWWNLLINALPVLPVGTGSNEYSPMSTDGAIVMLQYICKLERP